jgi:predicted TIM-barrel fold metal-dependent hydrolase
MAYPLFSVDDHIVEPAHVWVDRVPVKDRDRVPHVVEVDGRQLWTWEGGRELTMGLNAVAGKPREEWGMEPARFEDMIPGCYDPHERAKDLLSNGIFASVAFPTLPGFGGRKFATMEDKELALTCVRAWNDFVLDEWCAAAPEVFVPMTIAPTWDAELAAAELRRCVERGSKALCWVEDPQNIGQPNYHGGYWDPLFAQAQDLDVPVCMHIGSAMPMVTLEGLNPMTEIAAAFAVAARSATNMMVSPIPRKFPDIKLVWSEGGIGWVPAAMERADRQWERHQYWSHVPYAEVKPSEVALRNMWFCMIEEPVGIKYRHDFSVERILWESDYPHADTPFPNAQASVKEVFAGVPEDEIVKITRTNSEQLFDFPLSESLIRRYSTPNA